MPGINLIKEINKTPTSAYFNSHYFCDYIELLALLNNGDIVSEADIYDRFLEDERINERGGFETSEINDHWESRISEWFILLDVRQSEYGRMYPFIVENNTIKLSQEMDNQKSGYLFLLLSSTRNYIDDNNLLTTDFERVSYEVLKDYLPSYAQVFQFGKSNVSHVRYSGHITEKIDKLAEDLKSEPKYKPHFFAPTNNGDGGLDIVSWVSFPQDINQCNIQVYLAQCATGDNWLSKQDDTHKFPTKYINFDGFVNYIMFIPYDGRNIDREFTEESKMGTYLFFDRFRLLTILNDYSVFETISSFNDIVQKVIDYEEDII